MLGRYKFWTYQLVLVQNLYKKNHSINPILVLGSRDDFCLVCGRYLLVLPQVLTKGKYSYEAGITSSPYKASIHMRLVLSQVLIRQVFIWGWYYLMSLSGMYWYETDIVSGHMSLVGLFDTSITTNLYTRVSAL
jgi:hypothetical protein